MQSSHYLLDQTKAWLSITPSSPVQVFGTIFSRKDGVMFSIAVCRMNGQRLISRGMSQLQQQYGFGTAHLVLSEYSPRKGRE